MSFLVFLQFNLILKLYLHISTAFCAYLIEFYQYLALLTHLDAFFMHLQHTLFSFANLQWLDSWVTIQTLLKIVTLEKELQH